MNFNNSKYDSRIQEILKLKNIEPACDRQVFYNIHSGVRVKVQRKNSLVIGPIQQSIHHKSDVLALNQKILKTTSSLSETKFEKSNLLKINQKDKGIQTIMIAQVDRQTSCNIVIPTSVINQNNRSSSFDSETSVSNENSTYTNSASTETSTVSTTTDGTSEKYDRNARYQQNRNRNNNAANTDIERKSNGQNNNTSIDNHILSINHRE